MPSEHYDYLDGWRGLAILFLLVGHFFPVPGINLGALGVNLFFVLSGLLMAKLLFIKKTPLPLFYQRRISRIFPAFFFMLGVTSAVFLISGRTVNWVEVATAGLFVNNYFVDGAQSAMPFGHIWSLSVEEHSYVVLSLIAFVSYRHRSRPIYALGLFTLCSALAGLWYWRHFSGKELDFNLWLHSEVSAYGILASGFFLLLLRDRKMPQLPVLAYPLLMLTAIAFHWWSVALPVRTIIGVGIFALTVNLLNSAPPLVISVLSIRPLTQMGLWSFSIYLWQQPFYLMCHREGLPAWIALGLSMVAGLSSFYLIEQPMRNYLNARRARKTAPAALPYPAA